MFTDKNLVQLQETNQISDQPKYLKMINKMKSNKDTLLLFSKDIQSLLTKCCINPDKKDKQCFGILFFIFSLDR